MIEGTGNFEFQQSAVRQVQADFDQANAALDSYNCFEDVPEALLQRIVLASDALTWAKVREVDREN